MSDFPCAAEDDVVGISVRRSDALETSAPLTDSGSNLQRSTCRLRVRRGRSENVRCASASPLNPDDLEPRPNCPRATKRHRRRLQRPKVAPGSGLCGGPRARNVLRLVTPSSLGYVSRRLAPIAQSTWCLPMRRTLVACGPLVANRLGETHVLPRCGAQRSSVGGQFSAPMSASSTGRFTVLTQAPEITDMLGLHVGSLARPTGLTLGGSATVEPVMARPGGQRPACRHSTATNPVDCCRAAAGYCQAAGPARAGQRS